MNQIVYGICTRAARDQGRTSYAAVAKEIGMDTTGEGWRYQMGPLLDEVSRYEHGQGRPQLSVVVVREDIGRPGEGFFTLAKELGKFDGVDEDAFFVEELKAVHAEWKR